MKQKGFTLVELIGVIVILGVIAVFSIPALTKTFKDSAEKEYNEYIKNITLAAENYFHSETDGIINGKEFIKVGTLIENGYLKKTINPKTNEETSGDATIIISKNEDGTEKYDFVEFDVTESGYEADGLLLLYDGYNSPLDGFWNDLSGNGNNGKINGPVWDVNKFNFDGLNDYIVMGQYNYDLMTVEIVFETSEENNQVIVGSQQKGGCGIYTWPTEIGIQCYSEDNNKFMSIEFNNTELNTKYVATLVLENNILSLYINGDLYATINNVLSYKYPENSTHWVIGANPYKDYGVEDFFIGNVYNARIYNKALTETEVHNNYMVDKYRFDI